MKFLGYSVPWSDSIERKKYHYLRRIFVETLVQVAASPRCPLKVSNNQSNSETGSPAKKILFGTNSKNTSSNSDDVENVSPTKKIMLTHPSEMNTTTGALWRSVVIRIFSLILNLAFIRQFVEHLMTVIFKFVADKIKW